MFNNTHLRTLLLSPKLPPRAVQESELDGLNFQIAKAPLVLTLPSHLRMICPTLSSPPARERELELMTQMLNINQTKLFHQISQMTQPLEMNWLDNKSTPNHHRSTTPSSRLPSTLSWITSITLLNKSTVMLTQLTDLLDHTVSSSTTLLATLEATAPNSTDGLPRVNGPLSLKTVITSPFHSPPSFKPMRRRPPDGSSSQLALVRKTKSTLPRISLTLLSPPARETQKIHQTHQPMLPLRLLTV